MEGHSISVERKLTYLGVVLDHRLTWLPHVKAIRTACTIIFSALARVARSNWGLNSEALRLIYQGVFIPKMTYAAAAWYTVATKRAIIRNLLSAQRVALLRIAKAFRTTSTEALLVIAGEPPIDLLIRESAVKYMNRRGLPINIGGTSWIGTEYELKPKASEMPRPYERQAIRIAEENERAMIEIYSDGSKIDGRVGAAYTVLERGHEISYGQYRLEDYFTVYQAELFAILMAVRWSITTQSAHEIIIHMDSQAAIQTLQQYKDSNQMAMEVKKLLKLSNIIVKVKWVKAHVGVADNERADALAKEAANLPEVTYNKIPSTHIKGLLRQYTIEEWQDRWTYSNKGRHTYWLLPNVEERIKELSWLPIDYVRTQLYSNHCNTKEYLQRVGQDRDTQCDCGETTESLEHLVDSCIKHERERMQLHVAANQARDQQSTDLYMLIRNKDIVHELRNFARSILCKGVGASGSYAHVASSHKSVSAYSGTRVTLIPERGNDDHPMKKKMSLSTDYSVDCSNSWMTVDKSSS
ncbi:uncharacterized protein [Centruroides vittatus]|uniref:uncharacterized protein n=1 Tax=Centruroides vittatus TaxID=120091 RepID=UPI00351070A3